MLRKPSKDSISSTSLEAPDPSVLRCGSQRKKRNKRRSAVRTDRPSNFSVPFLVAISLLRCLNRRISSAPIITVAMEIKVACRTIAKVVTTIKIKDRTTVVAEVETVVET